MDKAEKALFNNNSALTPLGETLIVLFGGGTKRGQQRDIDRAKELLAEYKARKKAMTAKSNSKPKR